jgi:glyoxylase-like metal-dependent hydrolase (beta-lactamase superfamily II)
MGWSTSVVAPPDGDMGRYIASLEMLLTRQEDIFYPTHGSPIPEARAWVRQLIAHRRGREEQILAVLATAACSVPELVPQLYPGIAPALERAAAVQVTAHLLYLAERDRVGRDGVAWRLRSEIS